MLVDGHKDLTQRWEQVSVKTAPPKKVAKVSVEGGNKRSFPFWVELRLSYIFSKSINSSLTSANAGIVE